MDDRETASFPLPRMSSPAVIDHNNRWGGGVCPHKNQIAHYLPSKSPLQSLLSTPVYQRTSPPIIPLFESTQNPTKRALKVNNNT